MEESETYLSLGSNLGDRLAYLKDSIEAVSRIPGIVVERISGVYETEPVGPKDQPDYLNMAVSVKTGLDPESLLSSLKKVETELGRIHRGIWREREIDIDILFCGKLVLKSDNLSIPHPRAHERRFVLEPLAEIARDFEHPTIHKTIGELMTRCTDGTRVRRIGELFSPVNS